MKIRRPLVIICIILFSVLLLVACTSNNTSPNNVSLDFLITPDQIRMYSDVQLIALNEIEERARAIIKARNEKYDDLSKMSEEDIKIQEEIQKEAIDALNSGKIIGNKSTIENIFNQLRDLKGVYVDSFEEKIITRIDLIEGPKTESVVSLDNAYLRNFMLLEDGNMIIPKGIMNKSTNGLEPTGKIEYIKVKLPEEFRYELEEIAKDSNKAGEIEEVEVIEVPDMKNKTITVKREDLGEFTPIRKMESENVSDENELIKITITDYTLNKLKPNNEYKDYFKDLGIVNLDEIAILDINFKFENLSNDMLELDSLQGILTTNTGEEVSVLLDISEENDKNKFKFSGKEVKKGSLSAVLNSKAKEIESFKLTYDDSIILEFNVK